MKEVSDRTVGARRNVLVLGEPARAVSQSVELACEANEEAWNDHVRRCAQVVS